MKDEEPDFLPKEPDALYEWEANFLSKIDGVADELGLQKEMLDDIKKSIEEDMRSYEQQLEARDIENIATQRFKQAKQNLKDALLKQVLSQKHGEA